MKTLENEDLATFLSKCSELNKKGMISDLAYETLRDHFFENEV